MPNFVTILCTSALGFVVACGGSPTLDRHIDAITGEECEIDPGSYEPRDPGAPPPRVDCSHHDDVEPPHGTCCEFPQPGCDRNGCCDEEIVVDPGSGSGGDGSPIVI